MHKTLRTRLVGIGLVVALLALAVPALAQNQWSKQTTPASFNTPVQALGVNGGGLVSAATAGGGYPGGNLGYPYYSLDQGTNFSQYTMTPCPPFAGPGDDFTAILWDGAYGYTGTWNSGLYVYDGVNPPTNPTCGNPSVNQHVQALTIDPWSITGTLPHDLYFATWGGGVWKYNGVAFTHVFDPFTALVNGAPATPGMYFAWDIAFKQGNSAINPRMMFIATDGGGLIKGVQNWTTGVWTWTTAYTADSYVYAVEYDYASGSLFIGTKSNGILFSGDNGATFDPVATSPAITTAVNDLLFVGYPNFIFAATDGQGVFRFDVDGGNTAGCLGANFVAINDGFGSGDLGDLHVNVLAFDNANQILYAGTTGASATGNVYRITLTPFTALFTPTTPIEVGTPVNDGAVFTTFQNPKNWKACITAGSLPPGLSVVVNNTPVTPTVRIQGAPTADGCYDATLTVWDGLLNRVDIANPDYNVEPGVLIDATPNPAQYGTVIAFTSTVSGATGTVSYLWDFDSTGVLAPPGTYTSTQANPTFLYPAAGSFVVQLTVTDTNAAGGCTVSTTKTLNVDVFGNLVVDPTATIVGSGSQFQFDPYASGGVPNCATPDGYTYAWVFTDVQTGATITTSTLERPVITFPYNGTFKGQVTVTDCSGHTATGFTVVNYNGFMAATVASVCNPGPTGVPIQFSVTAHSISPMATPPYTVTFDFGDGSPLVILPTVTGVGGYEEVSWNHTYAAAGTYPVQISVFDGGSSTTIVPFTQTIYPQFTGITVAASPNPASGCDLHIGETITFTVTPQGGIAPYLYSVDFGDGTTATNSTGVFTHAYAAGTYTATFYATDSGNCAVTNNTTYGPFNVVPEPTANVYVNLFNCNQADAFGVQIPNFGVNPLNLALDATYTAFAGHTVNYTWTYNNNFAGDDPDTFSGSVVSPAPIPTFNKNFYLSPGDSYRTFTATLTLTDTGFCVNDTVLTRTIKFTIYNPLTVVAPTWSQACGSRTVTFNASASVSGGIPGYQYVWNFGDGSSAGPFTTPGPVHHTYATSGEYDAQLTVVDSALPLCTTTHNTANVIFHLSVVDPFTGTASATPTVGCTPLTVNFTSSVHGGGQPGDAFQLRWTATDGWDTGWGASATPTHVFTAATSTTYTWTLQARSTVYNPYVCTIATGTVHVDVAASNLVIVPTSTSDYIPLDDTFTTTWNDGSAPITLTYTLTRIKDKDGNFLPVPEVVTQTVTNATSPYQFTYTFEKTGTWTVVCNLSDTCTASLLSNIVTVQVLDTPALTVTTQTLINGVIGTSGLAPLTVNFSSVPQGGVPPYTFAWSFGDSTTSTAQNPIHTYTAPGVYNVSLTVTDSYPAAAGGPQHASANVTITVYNPLNVTASATPTTIITGATVNFSTNVTGGTGTYSYAWNFGDGGVGTGPAPAHQYLTAGTYFARVRVTDTATNFADSNDIVIRVYSPVTASASASPNPVIIGNSVAFTALASGGSGNFTYSWNFGDSTTGTGATINHTYTSLGTKNVVLTVTDTQLPSNTATVNLSVVVKPVPPQILASKKLTDPFRIVLFGTNFQPGCTATVNGTGVTVNFVNSGKIKLLNAKSLCPKGVPVPIVVTNPDGGVSNTYMFTR
jgi:PKD repeat protein